MFGQQFLLWPPTEDFFNNFRNTEVHYHIYKSYPVSPVQSQMNPVYRTLSYLCNIHLYYLPIHS
jgi:hypothetical protein